MRLRDAVQEVAELGARGTLFRVGWELRGRAGLGSRGKREPAGHSRPEQWTYRLQLEDPIALGRALRPRVSSGALARLRTAADDAVQGRILCFGRWTADFGDPIDWHRSPTNGGRWDSTARWFNALANERAGDVKCCWEAARFPHAYHMARAATFFPESAERYAQALSEQLVQFVAANPVGRGIHWASGQEIGLRLLAWLFALDVLLLRTRSGRWAERDIADSLVAGARHIEEHLDYARIAIYNNHLLSEALALFAVGVLLPDAADAERWRRLGRRVLDEQAERQFYADGGYIQQSHNYHRVAMQDYLWACSFARSMGDRPSDVWLRALERSLDLLVAHQNPDDGRLPNYGSNDGALPSPLSTCDFSDMRPLLQTVSVLVRGERLYEPGPWDEETAWFLGVRALDAPQRNPARRSVSFAATGYHVLRGRDERNFSTFRCGTLRDRFSQIDMLHLDVWWRGQNVLVDPGSFLYNASPEWHRHFMRTASHNTVKVDGHDQMLHFRQFKVLYWTRAAHLEFEDRVDWAMCAGEHYGYRRHPGGCVHRRAVLFVKDDLWIVADHLTGTGTHTARLHWLGGEFSHSYSADSCRLEMETPEGPFYVQVFDGQGQPAAGDVVAGASDPPRGWVSRYYGEKAPVPSLAVETTRPFPLMFVSVLAAGRPQVTVIGDQWFVEAGGRRVAFRIVQGLFTAVSVSPCTF
jgi:Heparinase II/III-like protein/Heparinase II/III N-terminus